VFVSHLLCSLSVLSGTVSDHATNLSLISRTQQGCFILVSQDLSYITMLLRDPCYIPLALADKPALQLWLQTSPLSHRLPPMTVILDAGYLFSALYSFCRLRPVLARWLTTPASSMTLQHKNWRTHGVHILHPSAAGLYSLLNVAVLLCTSNCDCPAHSTYVLTPCTLSFADTACCPQATGTRSQTLSNTSDQRVALSLWLAKCHLREWLRLSARSHVRMSTPPAALFHVPSSFSWLCIASTCYLQRLCDVPCLSACLRGPLSRRLSLSSHLTEGKSSKRERAISISCDMSSYPYWSMSPVVSTGVRFRLYLRLSRRPSCSLSAEPWIRVTPAVSAAFTTCLGSQSVHRLRCVADMPLWGSLMTLTLHSAPGSNSFTHSARRRDLHGPPRCTCLLSFQSCRRLHTSHTHALMRSKPTCAPSTKMAPWN
jgi:hypothetical protein